jgi:hypothetical protein
VENTEAFEMLEEFLDKAELDGASFGYRTILGLSIDEIESQLKIKPNELIYADFKNQLDRLSKTVELLQESNQNMKAAVIAWGLSPEANQNEVNNVKLHD